MQKITEEELGRDMRPHSLASSRSPTATAAATRADSTYGKYYNHPGIAVTASTGDNGYKGASYPASSAYVTAVGGTSLKMSGTSRVSETVWSGAGSGCSTSQRARSPARRLQHRLRQARHGRRVGRGRPEHRWPERLRADDDHGLVVVAVRRHQRVVADHRVGVRAGRAGYSNTTPYAHPTSLFDITSGSNPRTCPHDPVVQRARRLGRSDGTRHAERHRGVLTGRMTSVTQGSPVRAAPSSRPVPPASVAP